uniref:PI3K/PI4K catalytic domain-containing protein n=1 Tax=Ditylenchus dipsaci TaxID=166011 RepID=A0A915DTP7_9BILA
MALSFPIRLQCPNAKRTAPVRMEQQCVEVHLLRCMLRMVDVHHENFGIDNEGKLRIVDFVLPKSPAQSHMFNNPELYDCLKRVEPGRRKAMPNKHFADGTFLTTAVP